MFQKAILLLAVLAAAVAGSPLQEIDAPDGNVTLVERQSGPITPSCVTHVELVGNGSPEVRVLHKQISTNLNCGGLDGCEIGESSTESFSLSASLGGASSWISGGFGVTRTWETGRTYTCPGLAGKHVCIWYSARHIAYKVRNRKKTITGYDCNPQDDTVYTMVSPSTTGNHHYCVVGHCQEKGFWYWGN